MDLEKREKVIGTGIGLNTWCPKTRLLISVGENRLENQCLRPFPTGSHGPFSSSGCSLRTRSNTTCCSCGGDADSNSTGSKLPLAS